MAIRVKVPRLSENTDEATVTAWFAKEGDPVQKGRPLVELTTDKAAFEVEAPATGQLLRIYAKTKSVVPIGFVLGLIGRPDEKAPEIEPTNARLAARGVVNLEAESARGNSAKRSEESPSGSLFSSAVRATPAARRLARELGVNLADRARQIGSGLITENMVREWSRRR